MGNTRRLRAQSKVGQEFDEACRWVRATFPVSRGYRIDTVSKLKDVDGSGLDGEMRYVVGSTAPYRILIRRGMKVETSIETLLHEVAHVLDVEKRPGATDRADPHSGKWGEEYARVYRAYLKWIGDKT
jgi:hypothetical protein